MSKLPSQADKFPEWYTELIRLADLAEISSSPGSYILKPYGYAIWEKVKEDLNKEIKKTGTENAYFPLFIPEGFLKKEKDHIEGFSPELAVVTHGGGKELSEKLVVRPTSETIIYDAFSKWIASYRDLPLKINQWANVVRWEMRPRPFLRSREFLWQEGHTAHASDQEADEFTYEILRMYEKFDREVLSIPVITGRKSESEKFAGAKYTLTTEALAKDGKAIQAGTSHHLGTNFSESFDISFLGQDEKKHLAHQTSWAISSRIVGTIIMIHGDDLGLKLPPKIAPLQVVLIPINKKDAADLNPFVDKVNKLLSESKYEGLSLRFKIDDREGKSPGFKFNEWEVKGVPIRIEAGPRDAEQNSVVLARRDNKEKKSYKIDDLPKVIPDLLKEIQENLLSQAEENLKNQTRETGSIEELKKLIKEKGGFVKSFWCEGYECEEKVKKESKATTRCIPFEDRKGKCLVCGKEGVETYFAKAY